ATNKYDRIRKVNSSSMRWPNGCVRWAGSKSKSSIVTWDRARVGPIAELPDGTVIAAVGEAYTIVQGRSLASAQREGFERVLSLVALGEVGIAFRWSEQGYQAARQISRADGLLSPPSTLLAFRAGYRPALHPDLEQVLVSESIFRSPSRVGAKGERLLSVRLGDLRSG